VGLGVAGQYVLGVTTLMNYVPVELGTAHQAGALTLWTLTLWVLHSMRPAAAIKAAGVAGGPRMKVAAAAVAAVPVMAVGKGSAAGKVSM
jgi:cytochrome c oxidase assembly protein subunit 15